MMVAAGKTLSRREGARIVSDIVFQCSLFGALGEVLGDPPTATVWGIDQQQAIRIVLGEKPEGARLRVARESHNYGAYFEEVCEFDAGNETAATYAMRCDAEAPTEWALAGLPAPVARGRGGF